MGTATPPSTRQFGRGLRKTTSAGKEIATTALNAYLELYAQVYNWISETLLVFIAELQPLEMERKA
jgi:hypothetical protein